jgi:PAS domain S-box-containing protein
MEHILEELYRLNINDLPLSMMVLSWKHDDFIIMNLNSSFEEMESISRFKLVGKKFLDVFPRMNDSEIYKALIETLKEGNTLVTDAPWYNLQGNMIWKKQTTIRMQIGDLLYFHEEITS